MKEISDSVDKDKECVINPNHVNIIDYNSRSFLRGLSKVKKKSEEYKEMSIVDNEKKHPSFNI